MNHPYLYVALTVLTTVASQTLFKKGVTDVAYTGVFISWPNLIGRFMNLYIVLGVAFSLISILSWLHALSKLQLSQAYPYMSLTFPLVLISSMAIFGEQISWTRWLGTLLIVVGLTIVGRDG